MKLLIVDDEPKILQGLTRNMNWLSLGIMEVLNAENGLEGLRVFQKQLPEIVITDMRMPGLDGIQLCKRIRAIREDTRIIILSGYADFDYVKDALKLGINDYELKPVRFSRLQETIRKQIGEIETQKSRLNREVKLMELSRENFMHQVLNKKSEPEYIYNGMKEHFGFSPDGNLILLKVDIDRYYRVSDSLGDTSAREFQKYLEEKINLALEPFQHIFYGRGVNGTVVVIRLKNEAAGAQGAVLNVLRELHGEINRESEEKFKFSVSFGISSVGQMAEINKMYAEAGRIVNYRFHHGCKAFMAYGGESTHKKEYLIELDEDAVFKGIENLNLTVVLGEITKVFEELKKLECTDVDCIRFYYFSFRNLLVQKVNDMGKSYQALCCEGGVQDPVLPYFDTIDEYKNDLIELFKTIILKISDNDINVYNPTISKAVDYICMNYSDPNMGIELLAKITQKNPDYFSHIFRKEIGISFTAYINHIRVEKAKKLLKESNCLVYEISGMVGFNDFKYFTQVFKKSTGFSPSDYRKLG